MPRRKSQPINDKKSQQEAKAQLAMIRLTKAEIAITPERFHVLMCAQNSGQMQDMIDAMQRATWFPPDLLGHIQKLMEELKEDEAWMTTST